VAFLAQAAHVTGQQPAAAPSPTSILAIMEHVADWQIQNPSEHASTDWTQGAGDAGFMALAGISGNPRYREAMLAAGEKDHWQPGPRFYHADDHCVGQTFAELYLLYRDPRMIAPLSARFDGILERPSRATSLEFSQPGGLASQRWSWCDSLFMGPPAWVRLYAATGDARYLDFAVKQWWGTTDYLYDPGENLYFRDSTYFQRREANGRKVFWSRGNGWVMAGLVRVLQYLPMNHPDRTRFERLFTEMAAKILTCQQADGLWRASLLDPGSFPLRETSGSGFFTYALAWGVNQGLLDRGKFEPAVLRAWTALAACVEANGKLTHVQPIGADPKGFPEDSTEVYGVGAFLLAGSEVYRIAVLECPTGGVEPGRCHVTVNVTNPAGFYRQQETVEIDPRILGHPEGVAVMDGVSSRILDSQVYASEPGKAADKLIFQVNLAPGETRRFQILPSESCLPAAPKPIVRTYARLVPERFNDVAWESDRTAHRMYHVDLIKAEGTISSGIDVWSKRTRDLVVDEWYKRRNYHEDVGDGLDDYHVSKSRGCGGLGVWSGGKLYVSSNFRSARIITTGPIRSEFTLDYDGWDADGRKVTETKRISIDAGSNMSRVESVFSSDVKSPLLLGVGIALRAGSDNSLKEDREAGWMTYWQAPDRERGRIGCAVVLPAGSIHEFVTESGTVSKVPPEKQLTPDAEGLPAVGNQLAITQVDVGKSLVYYVGAGWTRSGDFANEAAWTGYVSHFAERRAAPLTVAGAPMAKRD
jgi:rhamnogalacturonyl hydrolase YesR